MCGDLFPVAGFVNEAGGAASEPKHCRDAMNEVLCKARAIAFLMAFLIQVLNEMNAFDLFPFHTLHTLM